MNNIMQFIKDNIGGVIVAAMVALLIAVYFIGAPLWNGMSDKAGKSVSASSDMEYDRYNGTTVSGADVIEAARNFKDKPQFSLLIKTNGATAAFYAQNTSATTPPAYTVPATGTTLADPGTVAAGSMITIDQMKDVTNLVNYVNPTSSFTSKYYRAKDGSVRLISFVQK